MEISKVGNNGRGDINSLKTTIPKMVKELLSLEKGNYIGWEYDGEKFIVSKIK